MNNSPHERKVVITGLGAVSPVGLDVASTWEAVISGKSGIGNITLFDTTDFDIKIGGEVKDFDATRYAPKKHVQRMDRFTQFAVAASLQAVEQAQLEITDDNALDCGVIIGNSVCGLLSVSKQYQNLAAHGPSRVSPILAPTMTGDAASVQVSLQLGAKGANYAPSSACSSGSDALGHAYEEIKLGNSKVMIAGGTEAPIMPIVIAAFANIRALSAKNDTPKEACRPFDAQRNGFVMSEGSAMMVLEDAEYAVQRGAKILAELASYSATSDAFHLTQPAPGGESAAYAVRLALQRAGLNPDDIDYINAHGTATQLNDKTETAVIKSVFGDRAGKIPISANKSMIGHLLGAAGSIEALLTIMSIQNDTAPPTINLIHPDPECDLDYVPHKARKVKIKTAMSNSFGFGGHNSVLIFREFRN